VTHHKEEDTMKKLLTVVLALIIGAACLTGCAPREIEQTNESLTVAYYGVDRGNYGDMLNEAASRYRKAYPEVDLVLQRQAIIQDTASEEDYFTQLAASMMAGKGPDLILLDYTEDMDLLKMVKGGAFADLGPYFQADPSFDSSLYASSVMEAGIFDGKQYLIPISYNVPVLVSEKKLLAENGLDLSGCKTALEQWETLSDYARRCQEDPDLVKPFRQAYMMADYPRWLGLELMDYQTGKVSLDYPELKQCSEYFYEVYQTDPEDMISVGDLLGAIDNYQKASLLDDAFRGMCSAVMVNLQGIASFGEGTVIPLYTAKGEVSAELAQVCVVSRASPNQENASNFIKTLLSPEVQASVYNWARHSIPVNWEAFEGALQFHQKGRLEDRVYSPVPVLPDLCPIPENLIEEYDAIVRSVSVVTMKTPAHLYLREALLPYWEGKATYEEAIKEAEATLKIYISE